MKQCLTVLTHAKRCAAGLSPALLLMMPLAACIGPPTGPTVVALPGHGRSLQEFQADETVCRNYAQYRLQNVALANTSVAGAPAGASNAPLVGDTDQQRYDVSYAQCMTSKDATINNNVLTFSGYPYGYGYWYGYGYPVDPYWY